MATKRKKAHTVTFFLKDNHTCYMFFLFFYLAGENSGRCKVTFPVAAGTALSTPCHIWCRTSMMLVTLSLLMSAREKPRGYSTIQEYAQVRF